MGKIGDLFVRLGLKSDGFKKGMQDAKKETNSFGQTLGKMKAGAVAIWAAIGASVIAFGKEMINTTNAIGDAWGRTTAAMTAGWKTFVQAVSNFDFRGFIGKFKETTAAAVELQNALDAQFEGSNSVKIQRALMADELEELRIAMRDQTKSYKERLAAAEEYMRKVRPIYEQETRLAYDLLDAQQGKWLAGTGLTDNATTRSELTKFLIDYGKDKQLAEKIARYVELEGTDWNSIAAEWAHKPNSGTYKKARAAATELWQTRAWLKNYGAGAGYSNFLGDFGKIYEKWRGDADTQPLVEALINAGYAEAGLNSQTRQIQNIINSLRAKMQEEVYKPIQMGLEQVGGISAGATTALQAPDIFTDEWLKNQMEKGQQFGEEYMAMIAEIDSLNNMLEQSFINAFSGGMQAFTDMLMGIEGADASQIMAAVMQPIASTATQLGEMLIAEGIGIEAFKDSLKSLQGGVAIAAGASLIALGAALSSGIKKLGSSGAGGTTASTAQSSTASTQQLEQEITINVVGQISGDKIILAGQKTLNKWSR